MEDYQSFSNFNYLAEDMMLNQLSLFAENVCKALPLGNEGTQAITAHVKRMKAKKEKWPDKIIKTLLKRVIPAFLTEAITKLIQSYLLRVDEVNENRKRQREALKTDIGRKKRLIDDIIQKMPQLRTYR